MAKMLRCRDVGVDCDAVIRAKTEEELMRKVAEHAKKAHGMSKIQRCCSISFSAMVRNSLNLCVKSPSVFERLNKLFLLPFLTSSFNSSIIRSYQPSAK